MQQQWLRRSIEAGLGEEGFNGTFFESSTLMEICSLQRSRERGDYRPCGIECCRLFWALN